VLALGGCSGSSTHKTTVNAPADVLAALAAQGASAVYTATYTFHQVSPDTTATVKVWRAEPSLRVDVVAGNTTATLLSTSSGSYSCSMTGAKRSCLLVANAGAPVPAPFDVAPANLFSADLHTLATNTSAYDVRAAAANPASGGVPASQCFDVSSVATASPSPTGSPPASARVPDGRYCFTSAGVLAAASYPSGNTITLTSLETSTPAPDAFTPYAKPTPLPS
ncbi:MAG TPA: hypothetical protein VKJ07_11725, partial [Mycobacteriales bacterium]|nr:hypothetical protein [Mycobacteriales bacterium]